MNKEYEYLILDKNVTREEFDKKFNKFLDICYYYGKPDYIYMNTVVNKTKELVYKCIKDGKYEDANLLLCAEQLYAYHFYCPDSKILNTYIYYALYNICNNKIDDSLIQLDLFNKIKILHKLIYKKQAVVTEWIDDDTELIIRPSNQSCQEYDLNLSYNRHKIISALFNNYIYYDQFGEPFKFIYNDGKLLLSLLYSFKDEFEDEYKWIVEIIQEMNKTNVKNYNNYKINYNVFYPKKAHTK